MYQDLGASPAGIFVINANIAYGCCPGHKTTASDALQAYLQSHLKSANETWLENRTGFTPYVYRTTDPLPYNASAKEVEDEL